jgi:phytoene dehydrogenase-like protein
MTNGRKAIIVGGGIAGIATSIRLAVQGFDVEVFEKNDVVGGKMYLIEKRGFYFDAGPSLFTQPQNLIELFEYAGETIGEYFNYSKVPIACKYFFEI